MARGCRERSSVRSLMAVSMACGLLGLAGCSGVSGKSEQVISPAGNVFPIRACPEKARRNGCRSSSFTATRR